MSDTNDILSWLDDHKTIFNIRGIESDLIDIHKRTRGSLSKAINGLRKLPADWEQPLRDIVIELKKTLPL